MEADEKKCPSCAETVKAEAQICRHCGYDFVAGTRPSGPGAAPVQEKAGMLKKGVGCLVLLVLALIGFTFLGSGGTDKKAATDSSEAPGAAPAPAMSVTAKELASAYEANEAAAQERYGSKPLQVTGTVSGVTLDMTNEPVVELAGTNQFLNVQAALAEGSKAKASSVSKGQTVTVTCASVSEVVGTPMLADCELP